LTLAGTALSGTSTDGFRPGTLGFAYAIPAASGIVLGAVYMLHLCGRVLLGQVVEPPHTPDLSSGLKQDLTKREISILVPIALLCVVIGVYPKPLMNAMQPAIAVNVLAARAIETDRPVAAQSAPAADRVEPLEVKDAPHGS
jgi:NADH-quinone oxidoreductase subunit M